MRRRAIGITPETARTEGVRKLREALRTKTYAELARALGVDESAPRFWATEVRVPDRRMRDVIAERLAIAPDDWEAPLEAVRAPDAGGAGAVDWLLVGTTSQRVRGRARPGSSRVALSCVAPPWTGSATVTLRDDEEGVRLAGLTVTAGREGGSTLTAKVTQAVGRPLDASEAELSMTNAEGEALTLTVKPIAREGAPGAFAPVPIVPREARPCRACRHEAREAIDRELAALGVPHDDAGFRAQCMPIATRYQLPVRGLQLHASHALLDGERR